MQLPDVSLKRLSGYWLLLFVLVTSGFYFLYHGFVQTGSWFLGSTIDVYAAPIHVLVAWAYFRGVPENTWSMRVSVACAWVVMTMAATALVFEPVYGVSAVEALGIGYVQRQWMPFASIILGAILAVPSSRKLVATQTAERPRAVVIAKR